MRTARVEARVLAALLLCAAAAAHGAELGTLFHTPEERARLDRLRRGEQPAAVAGEPAAARELTGYVKRSDGLATVWIDGVPVQVPASRAVPLLEPGKVRGYADREDDDLRIERKRAR